MQNAINEFGTLQGEVLAIDPRISGSMARIARVKAQLDKSFEEDRISTKQWRMLSDELRLIQRSALGKIKAGSRGAKS